MKMPNGYIRFAMDGARRMQIQIEDLLGYSRIGSGGLKLHDINMNTVLQEALRNLHGKITENGAKITVEAKERHTDWLFSIADNGIGINKDYAEKVFAIFQCLHGGVENVGRGIGLSICRKIVLQHGGNIWFESHLGKGTTFCFNIPKEPIEI